MRIVTVVFGGGVSTLGMEVIVEQLKNDDNLRDIEIEKFSPLNPHCLKNADILFVSLCWFSNVLEYLAFLKKYGIDPKKRKPIIVIGGIVSINTKLLRGFFNYAILGDGEPVICDVIKELYSGSCPGYIDGVVKDGNQDDSKNLIHSKTIPAHGYVEDRGNNTTRIEIARGCRYKCPFCQLAYTKPYIEQPIEVIRHLITKSPTKSIGLFAPDRSGYSHIEQLEEICKKAGKHNTAEDLRLDTVRKMDVVSKLKFGVEGFREETRKRIRKVSSNKKLIEGLKHIFTTLKKPNGKMHTTATMYMIGDLPGETPENSLEFWDVLREADEYCSPPFTLFLTLNSFSPKPYTPWEKEEIHPYNGWKYFWDNRPRLKNITIASRGGMLGPSNRITHLITARGDDRLTKLVFWLANEGHKLFLDSSDYAGKTLEKLIKKQGVNPEFIYGKLSESDNLPHCNYIC